MINNLPDISKAFGEEKTQEQILDSLQKYRKELNFLLMNLDESNMPAIAGRLEGIDGSFSLINQDLDSITLAVGNVHGDISALQLRADGIDLSVSNLDGDLSALQITVGGISSTVSNHTGQISTINQTVSGISTTVSNHNTTIGTHTTQISQLDNEISSIVSFTDVTGNQIVSKITQTATNIYLLAEEIDLEGITRILSGNSEVKFDTYGDFSIKFGSYYPFSIYNNIPGIGISSTYGTFLKTDGDDTWAQGYWDFTNPPTVDGDDIVTCNLPVTINATWFGIDIRRSGYSSITIPWGWSP